MSETLRSVGALKSWGPAESSFCGLSRGSPTIECAGSRSLSARDVGSVFLDVRAKRLEIPDATVDFGEVPTQQRLEVRQHGLGRTLDGIDGAQFLDLGQRQPERLQPRDEAQSLDFIGPVDPPPARAPAHIGKQFQLFVVAKGARGDPYEIADFANGKETL